MRRAIGAVLAALTVTLYIGIVAAFVAGVWSDPRWATTGFILLVAALPVTVLAALALTP